jgi:signal transduction histidine kinase/HAMP domain-containing protein
MLRGLISYIPRVSLNTKLLLFALLLMTSTGIVTVVSLIRGHVLHTKNDAQLLYIDILKAHTFAKLFLKERNTKHIDSFRQASQRFSATLRTYQHEWFSAELLIGTERLHSTFEQIITTVQERGMDENSGAEGAFRQSIHELQRLIELHNAADLNLIVLETRRREKDFFLRGDTVYVSRVRNSMVQMLNALTVSPLPVAVKQQMQFLAMRYLQEFEHTVRAIRELHLLEQQLDKDFQAIEPVIARLERVKQEESAQYERQMIIIILVSFLGSLIAAVVMSRRLSAPLTELQQATRELASGKYDVHIVPRTRDEIADLGAAFNTMTEKIRRRTEELHSSYNNLRMLSTIGRELASTLDTNSILQTLHKHLQQLLPQSDIVAVGMLNHQEQCIDDALTMKNDKVLSVFHTPLTNKNSLSVWCIEHHSEVFINDNANEYSRYVPSIYLPAEVFEHNEFPHSMMFVPLMVGDEPIGVISVQSFRKHAYQEFHLDTVRTLASAAAAALNNANAFATVQQQNREILRQQALLEQQAVQIQESNTELQEKNLQLIQMNNEKNEFLGIAAHDLKNPLAAIQMSAAIIEHYYDKLDKKGILERARLISETSKRMSEIITNLLDINAIESGRMNFHPHPVDVGAILSQTTEDYVERAAKKHIALYCTIPDHPLIVVADSTALRQIFENLISNAVKYSPPNKQVSVKLIEQQAAGVPLARISVSDQGPGLSEQDHAKLFGKFARLSAQPTGGEDSTGLGLSIVKRLVETMHGRVWCESTLGFGATFIVELPLSSVDAALPESIVSTH